MTEIEFNQIIENLEYSNEYYKDKQLYYLPFFHRSKMAVFAEIIMYIIKSSDWYLDGKNGGYNDPGRTHFAEGAKQFANVIKAKHFIEKTIKLNPHRNFTEDSFEIINQS